MLLVRSNLGTFTNKATNSTAENAELTEFAEVARREYSDTAVLNLRDYAFEPITYWLRARLHRDLTLRLFSLLSAPSPLSAVEAVVWKEVASDFSDQAISLTRSTA